MKLLQELSKEIQSLTKALEQELKAIDTSILTTKQNTQNRTIKQIVGHMVDSASNNTHRIIHLQYNKIPLIFPDYANLGVNDIWLALQNYNNYNWENLIELFKYTNLHIAHVIENIDPSKLQNTWITALDDEFTLEEMIVDYPLHFKLHYNEIKELEKP